MLGVMKKRGEKKTREAVQADVLPDMIAPGANLSAGDKCQTPKQWFA